VLAGRPSLPRVEVPGDQAIQIERAVNRFRHGGIAVVPQLTVGLVQRVGPERGEVRLALQAGRLLQDLARMTQMGADLSHPMNDGIVRPHSACLAQVLERFGHVAFERALVGFPQIRDLLRQMRNVQAVVAGEIAQTRRLVLGPGVEVPFVKRQRVWGSAVGHAALTCSWPPSPRIPLGRALGKIARDDQTTSANSSSR
jgi:hypothetical protein